MILAIILISTIHSSQGLSWRRVPCNVTVSNRSVSLDCSGRSLREIPTNLIWNTTQLDLSANKISLLTKSSFCNLINVSFINLRLNAIENCVEKENNIFSDLLELETLMLDHNKIAAFPKNLPSQLQNLSLNSNRIKSIKQSDFNGLKKLKVLRLKNNCYNNFSAKMFIGNGTFQDLKLTELDLSKNGLDEIPTSLPRSLQLLLLMLNRIEQVHPSDLNRLTNLKTLDLSGNCPICFTTPFPCTPCKTKDGALQIHPDAFSKLSQLQDLRLSGNSLQIIDSSWFQNLTHLKYLYLSFNYLIGEFQSGDFLSVLPQVEVVDFSYNNPKQIFYKRMNLSKNFASMESLRTLHLEGYFFQQLEEKDLKPLFGLRNLSVLNLGVNFVERVNLSVFSNFYNLSLISLIDNRLTFLYHTRQQSTVSDNDSDEHHHEGPYIHKNKNFRNFPPFTKPECLATGPVLDLSRNNIYFIEPTVFMALEKITCLNLSSNFISSCFNGTEFIHIPHLKYLDLSYNRVYMHSDSALSELKELEILDLSHNKHYFVVAGVSNALSFLENLQFLKVLNLSWNEINTLTNKSLNSHTLQTLQFQGNRLDLMWKKHGFENIFTNLSNLTWLDISYNKLSKIPNNTLRNFPETLKYLCMSRNTLSDFEWDQLKHLSSLEILDVSKNKLSKIPDKLSSITKSLRILDLSHNQIFKLKHSFLHNIRSLQVLKLANNRLQHLSDKPFQTGNDHFLNILDLQSNPIDCTCNLLEFILWLERSDVFLPRIATDILCDLPESNRGQPMISLDFKNACLNDDIAKTLYLLTSCLIGTMMATMITIHMFYWEISYIYNFCKARINGYYWGTNNCTYDAFVMYDTKDPMVADWVFNQLRFELEDKGKAFRPLCLADRDWTPGTTIMDNLSQSVHQSRKTIFVLTEGFVHSGIFKMTAFLAQQRLLEEGVDVMVLVLLEPVLLQSRILNLRRCLCGHSVLEWPKNPAAENWFWESLRNTVRCEGRREIISNYYSSH